jgi:MFS family permease
MNFRNIANFLGLRRSIVGLLAMAVLVGLGEKMAERFLPLYLVTLGAGALSVGFLNAMDNFQSAIYAFYGGYISDRLGIKRALLVFNLLAMTGFLTVAILPYWQAALIGAFFFLSWTAISLPATMNLIYQVLPDYKRIMGVTMHSLIRRIPMAAGPILGGLLIQFFGITVGIRIAFLIALLMAILAAAMQQIMIEKSDSKSLEVAPEKNPIRLFCRMDSSLRNLLISDILIRFCEQIPYPFVVIWCMKTIASPVGSLQFGILTAVEMTTAMLIYIPVAHFVGKGNKKLYILATFIFFALFPLILLYSRSFWPLVLAFIIRGFKEFGEPTRKALIIELAPLSGKAGMFGLYYLIRDTIVSVIAFTAAFLWRISPAANFLTAFIFGILGVLWFAKSQMFFGRHHKGLIES